MLGEGGSHQHWLKDNCVIFFLLWLNKRSGHEHGRVERKMLCLPMHLSLWVSSSRFLQITMTLFWSTSLSNHLKILCVSCSTPQSLGGRQPHPGKYGTQWAFMATETNEKAEHMHELERRWKDRNCRSLYLSFSSITHSCMLRAVLSSF